MTTLTASSASTDTVFNYRLFEALRKGEQKAVEQLLASSSGDPRLLQFSNHGTVLHVAVAFAPKHIVANLLNDGFDPNARNANGQAPLHTAAQHGRLDIVKMLLDVPGVNFSVRDSQGYFPEHLSKSTAITTHLTNVRKKFADEKSRQMHELANDPNSAKKIKELFDDPTVEASVDINAVNASTGMTVLHELASCGNVDMVKWCLEHLKADPFKRDKKGKYFYEVTKDERMKLLFKRARHAAPMVTTAKGQPPNQEGVLEKWTNYASGYKSRWFVLAEGRLAYFKTQDDVPHSCRGSLDLKDARIVLDTSDPHRFDVLGIGALRYHLRAEHVTEAQRWVFSINESKQWITESIKGQRTPEGSGKYPPVPDIAEANEARSFSRRSSAKGYNPSTPTSRNDSVPPAIITGGDDLNESLPSSRDDSEDDDVEGDEIPKPLSRNLDMTIDASRVQLSLVKELITTLSQQANSESLSGPDIAKTLIALMEGVNAIGDSMESVLRLSEEHAMVWKNRYEAEKDRKVFWEDSLRQLATDHDNLQQRAQQDYEEMKTLKRLVKQKEEELRSSTSRVLGSGDAVETSEPPKEGEKETVSTAKHVSLKTGGTLSAYQTAREIDDEFFDAEDGVEWLDSSGDKEEMLTDGMSRVRPRGRERMTVWDLISVDSISASLIGYESESFSFCSNLRKNLPVDHSKLREDASIWSVLKKAIGKDLTRITLPASWNEPFGMLQRMCEDMEYSTLLDIAWRASRSTDRLLFVAAFAMSNYSSTTGRTGKPFNPLLGETFEYVRKDRGYRYISEQVSHHPPISACFCDGDHFEFFGEVLYKIMFRGKYVAVNPLGVTHVRLKNPGGKKGYSEHFSWRKVTTALHNLIVGTPWIDHYGDMEITNHETRDKCVLTFKAAGWRASDRAEVLGKLYDGDGNLVYELAGHWDDKLIARRVAHETSGTSSGNQYLDSEHSGTGAEFFDEDGDIQIKKGDIVLWKKALLREHESEGDAKQRTLSNYALTDFALTLNQLPEPLKDALPPTDSRLRPDQRLMEEGKYEAAAEEKHRLEEKQRATRKERDANGHKYKQKWFQQDMDKDTGEGYWRFTGEYWDKRARGDWSEVRELF